jgi:vacuole morphology and inheritance protein 14
MAEFLTFAEEVMVPFTPRLIPAILPNLAHHVPMIQSTAKRTNKLLSNVIQTLPTPSESPSRQNTVSAARTNPSSPPPPGSPLPSRQGVLPTTQPPMTRDVSQPGVSRDVTGDSAPETTAPSKQNSSPADGNGPRQSPLTAADSSLATAPPRAQSPMSVSSMKASQKEKEALQSPEPTLPQDAFDYQATVNVLTIQFLSEHEETRVAALKWLIMLHQKVPKKVGWYPILLWLS